MVLFKRQKKFKLKNKSKLLLFLAVLYFIFPLDFIPDLLPGIGWTDDLILLVVSLLVRYKDPLKKLFKKEKIIEGEVLD